MSFRCFFPTTPSSDSRYIFQPRRAFDMVIRWTCLALRRSRQLLRPRHRIRVSATINSPSSRGNRNRNRVKQGSSLFQFHRSRVCSAHIMRPAAPVGRSARREHSWFLTTRSVDPLRCSSSMYPTREESRVHTLPPLLLLGAYFSRPALLVGWMHDLRVRFCVVGASFFRNERLS